MSPTLVITHAQLMLTRPSPKLQSIVRHFLQVNSFTIAKKIILYRLNSADVNKFVKKLKDTTGVEKDKLVLEVEVADITAQTDWFLKGEMIKSNDRFEIKNLGGGKHQLVISHLEVEDAGEIKCRSGKLKSTAQLTVLKNEMAPIINLDGPIEGPAGKPLIIDVPYTSKSSLLFLSRTRDYGFNSFFSWRRSEEPRRS